MRRVLLSCLAGALIGLTVILLPLTVFKPPLPTGLAAYGQGDAHPSAEKVDGNAASSAKDSTAELTAPTRETSSSGRSPLLNTPLEFLGLPSISILLALSSYIAARRSLRR